MTAAALAHTVTDAQNDRITADHEIAHALAYLYHGRKFLYVDADYAITAVSPRKIDVRVRANIAMAGQMVDVLSHARLTGLPVADALAFRLEAFTYDIEQARDEAEFEDSWASDVMHTSYHLFGALSWALAFDRSNADLISELGGALVVSRRLTYAEVLTLLDGRMPTMDDAHAPEATSLVMAEMERIESLTNGLLSLPAKPATFG